MPALLPFHNIYRSTAKDPESVPDLVLLHGWGLHSLVWDDVMPELLQHFRVTVIDLPGMGQSPLPSDEYTLDMLVKNIEPLLPNSCHLVGWSLGGLVAIKLAHDYPDKVNTVSTICCSPKFTAGEHWPAAMAMEILDKFIEVYEEDAEGTLIRFLALNCKGAETMRDDVRKLKEIMFFCGLPARRALLGGLTLLRDSDLRPQLKALTQPTLMLFGETDHIVPAAVMNDLDAQFEHVTLALQQGVSHVPFISAPGVFVQALMDFYGAQGVVQGVVAGA